MLTRPYPLIYLIVVLTISVAVQGQTSSSRSQSVSIVRSFAERTIQFDDAPTKIFTLCNLSALLWKDDPAYAARLITASFEAVEKCSSEQCEPRLRAYLRNVVISQAAKLDAALLQQLMSAATDNRNSSTSLDKALNLVFAAAALIDSSPAKSISLAEQSLRFGVVKELRVFLFRLRAKDPRAADELFSKAVAAMASQPVVDAHVLMHLGAYLYKGPTIPETESAVEMVVIGDQLVVDLAHERTHVTPGVARFYLNNAVDILSQPVSDPEQLKLSRAAATQLFPKVQKVLPNRAAQLKAVLTSAPKTEASNPERRSSSEKEQTTHAENDSKLLEKTIASLNEKDFETATTTATKISDAQARKQSLNVINFFAALKTIDSDLETAQQSILRLDTSKEKAIAYLTIAKKYLERREKPAAHQAFTEALNEIRALPANEQGVFLLAAAHSLLALEMSTAKDVLAESFKKFPDENLETLTARSWTRTIVGDEIPHRFPLTVDGIEQQPAKVLQPFLNSDREWTIATILQIQKEKVLGPLLVSIARTVLQEDPRERDNVRK